MVCLVCGRVGGRLCPTCAPGLRRAPEVIVGRLLVRSALVHHGGARSLVRRLKYEGVEQAADVLAEHMTPGIPVEADRLIPVPRSLGRRVRYGIDQSVALAEALSSRTGLPVVRVLSASPLHLPNAGRGRAGRRPPRFRAKDRPTSGAVLVDDVLTTGTTLLAAMDALGGGVVGAVTATRAMPRSP